jgi:hypothetical protein
MSVSSPCYFSSAGLPMTTPQGLTTQIPSQQNLIPMGDYEWSMSTETKPVVMLSINLLVRVDIEKTYKSCLEIAKDNNAVFQGISVWSLTNPNRDVEYLIFVADVDSINKIIEKIKSSLNLTEENLLYSAIPSVRPKEKPPTSMAT